MNGGGRVQFASADLVDMVDNAGQESVRGDRSNDVVASCVVSRTSKGYGKISRIL